MTPGRLYRHVSLDASVLLCVSASDPGTNPTPWHPCEVTQDVVVIELWHDSDGRLEAVFDVASVVVEHYEEVAP